LGLLEDLFNVGNGIRSGIEDVPSFVGNVLTGDVHGTVTDGRKLIGDVGDVLNGVSDLGATMSTVSSRYAGTIGKFADSQILAAAQLAIEGEKATTGSGDPEEGNGYRESATRLDEAVETLIDATPAPDRWNGKASATYTDTNNAHRTQTSNVQVADHAIGAILSIEAGQVSRTRQTLDEASQDLYDYGLATAWMNYLPPLRAAKMAADSAAAAAALATTNTTMAILVKNSAENAARIRQHISKYEGAAKDTSGTGGACGTFVEQNVDIAEGTRPERLDPSGKYEVPKPLDPHDGPPAIPYGSLPQAPPARTAP
jgi:hypothetical protein